MDGSEPRTELVERFFAGTGRSYDFMVNAATFGIDRLWKRRIVACVPPDARRIVDLACGTGISTLVLARARPQSHVIGVELREEYLAVAREKAARRRVDNVEFVLSRAEDYTAAQRVDCIAGSYLPKYADLAALVPRMREQLRPGGVVIMHDFTYPPGALRRWLWAAYFKGLQSAGSRLFPSWREIYFGLPALIKETRWTSELTGRLQEAGFRNVRLEYLTLYGSALVTARV